MQQFLNFFPLPQGQGSFRPDLLAWLRACEAASAKAQEGQVDLALRYVSGLLAGQLFPGRTASNHLGVALKSLHPLPVLFLLGLLNGKPLVVFGKPFFFFPVSYGFEEIRCVSS